MKLNHREYGMVIETLRRHASWLAAQARVADEQGNASDALDIQRSADAYSKLAKSIEDEER